MAVYFFDSSGIVKRYAKETGSDWVIAITDPNAGNSIYMANITGVEVLAAIRKKVREGELSEGEAQTAISEFRYDYDMQYYTVAVTSDILFSAMTLVENYPLKGYDAVQLATALEVNAQSLALGIMSLGVPPLTFISADKKLNAASIDEGLIIEDPNNTP